MPGLIGAKYTNNHRGSLHTSTRRLLMAARPSFPPVMVTVTVAVMVTGQMEACTTLRALWDYLPIKSAAPFPSHREGKSLAQGNPARGRQAQVQGPDYGGRCGWCSLRLLAILGPPPGGQGGEGTPGGGPNPGDGAGAGTAGHPPSAAEAAGLRLNLESAVNDGVTESRCCYL